MSHQINLKRTRVRIHGGSLRASSKSDAFLDGVGTLLEIFPNPRPRTIRAFSLCRGPKARSVKEAIWGDWVAVAQDMWAAIEEHAPEKPPKEASARQTLTAR